MASRPERPLAGAARAVLPPLVLAITVVVAWQLVAAGHPYLLPRPRATVAQLVDHPGRYARTAVATLLEAALGLGAGGLGAVVLAVATVRSRLLEAAVLPFAVALNVTPVVAIAPALAVALGFGVAPKVVVTGLIVFFTVFTTTRAGLRSVDTELLEVLRVLHASPREVLVKVRLPAAVPAVLTGLRVALPLSVVGAVVAEFVATNSDDPGLGTVITTAAAYSDLSTVYAAIVSLAVIGLLATAAVSALERSVRARRGLGGRP